VLEAESLDPAVFAEIVRRGLDRSAETRRALNASIPTLVASAYDAGLLLRQAIAAGEPERTLVS